jgi:membrane protein YdbS with pleckstrin-like domain
MTDPAEPDVAWRGYSGWAMMPSTVVCFLLSAVLLTSGWFFDDVRAIGNRVGSFVLFWMTGVIWTVQILRWFYRGASYVYRLTPKHLYVDRGFLYWPEPGIDLTKVSKVEAGSNPLARLFDAGWVCLTIEGREPVCLSGLEHPAEFASSIQAAAQKARAS